MAKELDATLRRAFELRRSRMGYADIARLLDCQLNSAQQYVSLGRRALGLSCATVTVSNAALERARIASEETGVSVEFLLGEILDRELACSIRHNYPDRGRSSAGVRRRPD